MDDIWKPVVYIGSNWFIWALVVGDRNGANDTEN